MLYDSHYEACTFSKKKKKKKGGMITDEKEKTDCKPAKFMSFFFFSFSYFPSLTWFQLTVNSYCTLI